MKKIFFAAMVAFFCLGVTPDSFGRTIWKGSGGWGPGAQYNRMYDPATVVTISGKVTEVDKTVPMRGMTYGIRLVVKTDTETVVVHLGPGWFIEGLDVRIVPGDKVEVRGSKVMIEGKPVLIAAEVKRGSDVLTLRNAEGVPVWAGVGR